MLRLDACCKMFAAKRIARHNGRMKNTCSIEGCHKPVDRRGWCQMHYSRWYRHGDTETGALQPTAFRTLNCEHCKSDYQIRESRYQVQLKHFGGRKYCDRKCYGAAKAAQEGQRVSDKIDFCASFLRDYGFDPRVPTVSEYISGIAGLV